jgi:hypothetical protein
MREDTIVTKRDVDIEPRKPPGSPLAAKTILEEREGLAK